MYFFRLGEQGGKGLVRQIFLGDFMLHRIARELAHIIGPGNRSGRCPSPCRGHTWKLFLAHDVDRQVRKVFVREGHGFKSSNCTALPHRSHCPPVNRVSVRYCTSTTTSQVRILAIKEHLQIVLTSATSIPPHTMR